MREREAAGGAGHQEEVGVDPVDVAERDRREHRHRDPQRPPPISAPDQGASREQRRDREGDRIGERRPSLAHHSHQRSDRERVEERLAVNDASAAVAALEDHLGRVAAPRPESLEVLGRESEIPVPGQALGLHEVGRLVTDQARPAIARSCRGAPEGEREQDAEHPPAGAFP